tara:strand:+ start:323 stop:505 length:183 start_codon:yes stop_codon:yes gene_type:complete
METVTLEQIHREIIGIKRDIKGLKDCFHEDVLELSEETKKDIEESRQQIKEGKFVALEDI